MQIFKFTDTGCLCVFKNECMQIFTQSYSLNAAELIDCGRMISNVNERKSKFYADFFINFFRTLCHTHAHTLNHFINIYQLNYVNIFENFYEWYEIRSMKQSRNSCGINCTNMRVVACSNATIKNTSAMISRNPVLFISFAYRSCQFQFNSMNI